MTEGTYFDRSARSFELMTAAVAFYREARYDFAVISVQTSLETYLELRTAEIVRWHDLGDVGDVISDRLVSKYTFLDGRFMALWEALTGDGKAQVKAALGGSFEAYKAHTKVRNDVVHRGHHATREEAAASLELGMSLLTYVQNTTAQVGERLNKLEPIGSPGTNGGTNASESQST